MTDTKHTLGPWGVSSIGLTNDGKRAVASDDAGIAWVHPQTPYKRGDGWQHHCEEREANARLIAAAPDMLNALLSAEIAVAELCQDQDPANECWVTLAAVRAAIAKAKG